MTTRKAKAASADKITTAEMKNALLRSGYVLETRVESTLRKRWPYVTANNTYPDPTTGQSREYDIQGMIAYQAGPDERDFLFGSISIECINNPQPLVILTKQPIASFLHHEEIKLLGLPVRVQEGEEWKRLTESLKMESYHHYCRGPVGTQFCSFTRKKENKQWMATHEGSHFDSFHKLCAVVDYEMDHHFNSWVLALK